MSRRKKIIFAVSLIVVLGLIFLWAFAFYETDKNKIPQDVAYYKMGDTVDIGNNFFFDAAEAANGYSFRINSAEIVDYVDFLEKNGGTLDQEIYLDGCIPKYTYLLNVTIKNDGNTDGVLYVRPYSIFSKSLKIPIDNMLWQLIDENYEGWPTMKLVENTEVTLTLPFTPEQQDIRFNSKQLEKRMLNDTFYFCISEFPVRQLIEVSIK